MDVLEAIRTRRSVRAFRPQGVSEEQVRRVLEAARWAPSGLNNQPWRFVIVRSEAVRESLARCTKYGRILRAAPVAIAVFLDPQASYDRVKDVQGVGAALQTLLLAAHGLGLGACWIGEILNRRREVEQLLGVPDGLELMAVVALGVPAEGPHGKPERLPLDALVVAER
ncbi:MAG: nitroreductase [Deferrisomatales bacterium]